PGRSRAGREGAAPPRRRRPSSGSRGGWCRSWWGSSCANGPVPVGIRRASRPASPRTARHAPSLRHPRQRKRVIRRALSRLTKRSRRNPGPGGMPTVRSTNASTDGPGAPDLVRALTGDGRLLLVLSGLSLLLSGLFAVYLGVAGRFLPHDER